MHRRFLILIAFALLFVFAASAQTVESLRDQIRKAEEEIRINTNLLDKTRKDQNVSHSQLKLIQSRIRNRQSIVASLEGQINLINSDIDSKNQTVGKLTKEVGQLKDEYAQMLYTAYKNYKLNNFLVFLFASKDFNDVTKRVAFMRRYNRMRESKAVEIDSLSRKLSSQITDLDSKREELDKVKDNRAAELTSLGKDENQYKTAVSTLKVTESKLSNKVRQQQDQIKKIHKKIQDIIAEETRISKGIKKSVAEEQYIAELSGRFDQNKGKLPFPVRGGVVIDNYGVHQHPTQKGLTVNNKGVNIAAEGGAEIRCVFEGVVVRVFFFQGLNNTVMVRHGNYITIYAYLASVAVKTGDKVALNQKLGNISSSDNNDEHMVHFEIWQDTQNLNPSLWLRR